MDTRDDITAKRYLLSTIRMRFSPQVQQAKETIIDSIIEHVLFATDADAGITMQEIQGRLSKGLKVHIVGKDVATSLRSLMASGKVDATPETLPGIRIKGKKKLLYRLSADARTELEELERQSTRRFKYLCDRLFRDSDEGPSAYAEPFFRFLSSVFSRLAEESVRMIRGDMSSDQLISSPAFSSALNYIKRDLGSLSLPLFETAAVSFFRDPDPDYAAIKWNMAQNYYVLKVIGLDKQSLLLSKEVFANAIFYLDTNVVISALEPKESHHRAFLALCGACKRLGVRVRVCKITLDELDRVIIANRDMLQKTVDQIPEETAVKVASDFFEAYYEKKKSGQGYDIEAVFSTFISAEESLRDLFEVETEDDPWLYAVQDDAKTKGFAAAIAERYIKMRRRRKNDLAATHDATCLLWIEELRQRDNANVWFLTRDYTLPGCVPPDSSSKSLAITLDALIQWISPMAVDGDEERDITLAYSEIISSRILPQERIFSLEDFLIFHELDMECKGLPPEDVEGCIRHIKQNAPLLNPTDPADREKLARAIAIYFVDPSRKYKQDKERYEAELSMLRDEINNKTKQAEKTDAWLRVSHIATLFLVLEFMAVAIAVAYGNVERNTFQKIVDFWPLIGMPLPLCVVTGWFYLGKQRLRTLGWPVRKFFNDQ